MNKNTWVFEVLRSFLSFVDKIVYWLIEQLVILFDSLASFGSLFDDNAIKTLSSRIFFLISIIMISKVSFSIIQYIINPDMFSNQEKGMGKVIQSILVSLVLLVSIQWIFIQAYKFQEKLISSQIIPKLILGIDVDGSGGVSQESQTKNKRIIPFQLLSPFIQFNVSEIGDISYENGDYVCKSSKRLNTDGEVTDDFAECISGLSNASLVQLYDKNGKRMNCTQNAWMCNTGGLYQYAYVNSSYETLLETVTAKTTTDVFIIDYKFIASTAAGIFVVIMYFNFCLDLGLRVVKFGFLQLIAPIPILSMIDPKSAKSGMMSKWTKQCVNTYLGLFIRVAAVSFVIFILDIIMRPGTFESIKDASPFATLAVLFGALMFAKDLPKLISDLTGIDLKGDFKMNPLKRIPGADQALKIGGELGGAALAGTAGYIGGGIAAGIARGSDGNANAGQILGSTVMGAFRGALGGLKSGYGTGLKPELLGKHCENMAGISGRYAAYGDSTLRGRMAASFQTKFNQPTQADKIESDIKMLEDYSKYKGQMKDQADFDQTNFNDLTNQTNSEFKIEDILGQNITDANIYGAAGKGVKGLKDYYEDLKNSGSASYEEIAQARNAYESAQKFVITHADDGKLGAINATVSSIKKDAKRYASRNSSHSDVMKAAASANTYEEINNATIAAQNEAISKKDATYDQAVANRDAVNATKKNK